MIPDAAVQVVKVLVIIVLAFSLMGTAITVYKAAERPLLLWWVTI
jgi:hypothetical protein